MWIDHTRTSATPKVWSPAIFSLVRGTTSLCDDAERSHLGESLSAAQHSLSTNTRMLCYFNNGRRGWSNETWSAVAHAASVGRKVVERHGRTSDCRTPTMQLRSALTVVDWVVDQTHRQGWHFHSPDVSVRATCEKIRCHRSNINMQSVIIIMTLWWLLVFLNCLQLNVFVAVCETTEWMAGHLHQQHASWTMEFWNF